jgi:hypothetical protein
MIGDSYTLCTILSFSGINPSLKSAGRIRTYGTSRLWSVLSSRTPSWLRESTREYWLDHGKRQHRHTLIAATFAVFVSLWEQMRSNSLWHSRRVTTWLDFASGLVFVVMLSTTQLRTPGIFSDDEGVARGQSIMALRGLWQKGAVVDSGVEACGMETKKGSGRRQD